MTFSGQISENISIYGPKCAHASEDVKGDVRWEKSRKMREKEIFMVFTCRRCFHIFMRLNFLRKAMIRRCEQLFSRRPSRSVFRREKKSKQHWWLRQLSYLLGRTETAAAKFVPWILSLSFFYHNNILISLFRYHKISCRFILPGNCKFSFMTSRWMLLLHFFGLPLTNIKRVSFLSFAARSYDRLQALSLCSSLAFVNHFEFNREFNLCKKVSQFVSDFECFVYSNDIKSLIYIANKKFLKLNSYLLMVGNKAWSSSDP